MILLALSLLLLMRPPTVQSPPEKFRGVNNRLSPESVPEGFVAHAQNYRMRTGKCEPRLGCHKPGWLNATTAAVDAVLRPGGPFHGVAVFKDPNGIEWTLQCGGGEVYRCRPHNERYALPLPTGVRILGPCVPVQAFNKIWFFRGRYLAPLVLNDLDTGLEDLLPRWAAGSTYAANTEVAYGPFQAVTSITSSGGVATVTTTAEHGYITGADITISGAVQTEYNGRYNITVLDAFTFIYNFAGSATTPATGTIKCANMSLYWRAKSTVLTLGAGALTSAGTTATVAYTAHGFSTGQQVLIAGATQTEYNGEYTITVTGANAFTYTFAGSGTSPATGTITVSIIPQTGQSPDTHATKWTQIYDILPNADDALFINNRLLVPTAYTPGDSGYDSTSSYTKKDFLVATDVLDELHFDFANEFRINQGSDDEIVTLAKYNQDTVLVFKDRSWGILSNIRLDLSQLTLDMRNDGYGACARAVQVAGKNVFFPALKRGLVSVTQNELGKVNSVDIPFSNDIEGYVKRINWNLAGLQRLAYWNDCLYWAVALDDGVCRGEAVASTPALGSLVYWMLVPGKWYYWSGGDPGVQLQITTGTILTGPGSFQAPGTYVFANIPGSFPFEENGGTLAPLEHGNNAILVYDFRTQAWAGVDSGSALSVQDFFLPTYNGLQRLGFTANDGWCNLYEESSAGDQVGDAASATGLGWAEIATDVLSRGLTFDSDAPKKFKRLDTVLEVWNARFTLTASTGASFQAQTVRQNIEFSRTQYLKPFDKAPYVEGNANLDFSTPGRGNYSVPLTSGGVALGDGLPLAEEQQIIVRASVRTLANRYAQFEVANDQGRCTVTALGVRATEGQRRDNLIL